MAIQQGGKRKDQTTNGKVLIEYQNGRIIFINSDGVPFMMMGNLPDGTGGHVITKPTVSVFSVFS